jgi:hypothetical protein
LLGVYSRVLTLSPKIVTVKLSYNYSEPTRGRSYLSSTSGPFFEASQRFYRTIQYTEKKSLPSSANSTSQSSSPYGFHGFIDLEWPWSESVVFPPSHYCRRLSSYIKRFAMSCGHATMTNMLALSSASPPLPTVLTNLSDDQKPSMRVIRQ